MQIRVVLVLVMSVAAAAVVVPISVAQQPPPAQQPQRQQPWQYASFLRSDEAAVWQAPDQSAVAPDVFGVYEKLGGKLPRERVANTEVLNLVGQRGWELVAVTHKPGPEMTYWFKRAAR
jgi:hypothetical protein